MMKVFSKCHIEKPVDQFRPYKLGRGGRYSQCKECELRYKEANRPRVLQGYRIRNLKRYGLTERDYETFLRAQHNVCAICKTPEGTPDNQGSGRTKRLAVDHCHITGQYRGLLCNNCNRGLGLFKDSIDVLNGCIAYLLKRKLIQSKRELLKLILYAKSSSHTKHVVNSPGSRDDD